MRFSVVALGLIGAVAAAPLEQTKFDLPAVQNTFNDIQAGIDKMVADVKAFTGDKAAINPIVADSEAILTIIREGADKVAKSPAMGLMDAISVLGPVSTLSAKVDEIVMALAEKKEKITGAGAAGLVADNLRKQKNEADGLVKSILANLPMPGLLGIVAGPIAKQITDKLDAGAKAWSG
jgi:uncharacterized membrane protein YeaQ/YmgE (transglycosylase-associated protein family)